MEICQRKVTCIIFSWTKIALECGLILADTKYEFGRLESGEIILIDEIHTSDSSRFWLESSYLQRFSNNIEPENLIKILLEIG